MSIVRRSEELTSICVCTPDERFLETISDHLSASGFGPLPAANGSAAVRLCRYVRVEVLVLDLAFPNGTALDVLRRIAEPDFPEVGGILVLTDRQEGGTDLAALREQEPSAYVDDYLAKPFSFEELHGRIRTILRRRHNRDDSIFRLGELAIRRVARSRSATGRSICRRKSSCSSACSPPMRPASSRRTNC